MINHRLACLTLAGALAATAIPAAPALADGAASTRNIILGGAAVAGTLLIINHNKKVHQKYAEYDRRQAETQAQANNNYAAYQSERQAYQHEAALVSAYKHEVAIQHDEVQRLRHQLAMRSSSQHVAQAPRTAVAQRPAAAPAPVEREVANVSYGWGAL
jgi:hypothetical protein